MVPSHKEADDTIMGSINMTATGNFSELEGRGGAISDLDSVSIDDVCDRRRIKPAGGCDQQFGGHNELHDLFDDPEE